MVIEGLIATRGLGMGKSIVTLLMVGNLRHSVQRRASPPLQTRDPGTVHTHTHTHGGMRGVYEGGFETTIRGSYCMYLL